MRRFSRIALKLIAEIVFVIAHIILFLVCVKTLLFDYYNPRGSIITYMYIIGIAGAFTLIRWLIKPEYNHSYNLGYSDYSQDILLRCDNCDAEYNNEDHECPNCGVDL